MAIPDTHVMTVCRSSKPGATCSYLMMGSNGWECAKGTPFEPAIQQRRDADLMKAKGNNCTGPPDYKPLQ